MLRVIKKITLWSLGIILSLMVLATLLLLIFQKKIENYALSQLNSYLKTEVYVYDMDVSIWSSFPKVSIRFERVLITDQKPLPYTKGDTLLYADELRMNLNTMELWRGNYTISSIEAAHSRIGLRVSKDGEVNYDIVKETKGKNKRFRFSLKDVHFEDLDVSFDNYTSGQSYAIHADNLHFQGNFTQDLYDMRTSGNIVLKEIKSKSIVLLRNKPAEFDLTLQVNRPKKTILLAATKVSIGHLPFVLKGKFVEDYIDIRLNAANLSLVDLTKNIQSSSMQEIRKLDGKGKVNFQLLVNGRVSAKIQPLVQAKFQVKNGSLVESKTHSRLSNIQLSGSYDNHRGLNEEIQLPHFSFSSQYGDFAGQLYLKNFKTPRIKGELKGNVDLAMIHQIFPLKNVASMTGNLNIETRFDMQFNNPAFQWGDVSIFESIGNFKLQHVNLTFQNNFPPLRDANGAVIWLNNSLAFDKIGFGTGKTDFQFSGNFQEITSYFSGSSDLIFDIVASSNSLYSEDFYVKDARHTTSSDNVGAYLLPDHIQGNIVLSLGQLHLGKHLFSDVFTNASIKGRSFVLQNLSFAHVNTQGVGSVKVQETLPGNILVSGDLSSQHIDLKQLFAEWDNFDQKHVTSANIGGRANINMVFAFPFVHEEGIDAKHIEATIYAQVINGELENVATFKSISQNMRENKIVSTILNKHLDKLEEKINHLRFDTLENNIQIHDAKVYFPKMTIRSSALDMDVSGWQGFDKTLDYHFDFRFRDLKTVQTQTEFGTIVDDGTGIRLFLHLFGTTEQLKFKWDKGEQKAYRQEQWKNEKQNLKSMLKSEWGLYKKDSTIKEYTPVKNNNTVEITVEPDEDHKQTIEQEQVKKKGFFDKLRQQSKKENESQVEFEVAP